MQPVAGQPQQGRIDTARQASPTQQTPQTLVPVGQKSNYQDGLAIATRSSARWDRQRGFDLGMNALAAAQLRAQEILDEAITETVAAPALPSSGREFLRHPDVRMLMACIETQASAEKAKAPLGLALGQSVWLTPQGLRTTNSQGRLAPLKKTENLDYAALLAHVRDGLATYEERGEVFLRGGRYHSQAAKEANHPALDDAAIRGAIRSANKVCNGGIGNSILRRFFDANSDRLSARQVERLARKTFSGDCQSAMVCDFAANQGFRLSAAEMASLSMASYWPQVRDRILFEFCLAQKSRLSQDDFLLLAKAAYEPKNAQRIAALSGAETRVTRGR